MFFCKMNIITLGNESISGPFEPLMCGVVGNVISSSSIQVYHFQTNAVFNDDFEADLFSVMSPIFA